MKKKKFLRVLLFIVIVVLAILLTFAEELYKWALLQVSKVSLNYQSLLFVKQLTK